MNRMPLKKFLCCLLLISLSDVAVAADKGDSKPQKQMNGKNAVPEMKEADAPLDLTWLIQEAMEHNPEIVASQKRLSAAKARISQARSLDDPSVRAGSYDMSNNPVNLNGQTEMLQQRYGISQKIPFPGKLRLRGEVALEEYYMIEKELQAKMQEIIAQIKSAFYELYYLNNAIDVTGENRDLLSKFARVAETKYAVGKTTQRDVLAAQVELSTLANTGNVLNKERESVVARLNVLLDRPTQSLLGKPRPFEKHTLTLSIEELENLAVKNRPELKRFDHAVKRNEANLKLSKKDYYYSDFEPMVEYMQEDRRSDTWASAVTINVPWLWPKNRSKVKESREDLNAAKSDYRFMNNKTLFEVKDFLVKIQTSESTINLYKTGVIPQAEQSLKAARIGYETDRVDFLALIDSQRILLQARLLYARALADFEQNLAYLERVVGMQLTK
ncbi:MAG: TolC family protein [Candidatus Brocadia sp.]|uniref:Outer membrane efflux protein n=1 Tax=Candidatus Brocadia fulgida TaxID=380242 RepID=A0A0M2UY15_9BACT|nr:MAG: outer membrane efflux protein [Candidatus Brocadia fulgida]MCC6324315.1 TolC family protein [Candidatus Brocadia sp.]MCE7910434.1 TolC family protein [Candidatus Brocadia sp. AMX3]MBV6519503.1 Cobalt-zinc-cadmium resistance protein CzcC [Candidatus Brocadia fulgida]MDG5995464.1 TolC family protein [Candidatus Brocadia sp.]